MTAPLKKWEVLPHGTVTPIDQNILTVVGDIRMPVGNMKRRMTRWCDCAGVGVGHVHVLRMNNSAEWDQFQKLAGQVESTASAVVPRVVDLAARSWLVDTNRHRPAIRAKHPLLD
jgi:hypothetical protein